MRKFVFAVAIGLLLFSVGCGKKGESTISGVGVIGLSPFECWIITFSDNAVYQFSDLPEPYQMEGLQVRIIARLSKDQSDYCMTGIAVIDIVEIHRL
jgi:hypothetical protein